MLAKNRPVRVVVALVGALAATGSGRCAPPVLREEWGNLEGAWLFRTDPGDVGEREGWQRPEHPDSAWRTLQVPGSWEPQGITDPRPGQPPKPKDGMPWTDYDGVAWYRLHLTAPASWAGKDLALELGSIDDQDRTFLNGQLIGATGPGVDRSVLVWRRYRVPAALVKARQENVLAIRVFDGGGPGGINGPCLSLLPEEVAKTVSVLPQANRPLAERFTNPPADCRILKIIHSWPDPADDQDTLIRSLIARGFGGVVCNVSFENYLESEEKWRAFTRAVKEAKKAGMALWLYDERGYPSGNAGGITLRGHPEWEARGLLIADATSDGGPVNLDAPPGKLLLAAAFPVKEDGIDLNGATDLSAKAGEGKLSCDLPAGRWRVMVITEDRLYEGTHAAVSLADKLPYINLLRPEPTARFLEVTHQRYAERLGSDLGKYFAATFTDEPSLMSMFMRPMPYRVLPWSPNLPAEFKKRRGYALDPALPALVADAGGQGSKVRYHFWQTVGELVSENFFGQIQRWCRPHNTASGGHLLAEESLLDHVALYGDFFRCLRRLDAPSIDCLTSVPQEVPWHIARLISSAAELEGRVLTMCETSDFAQVYRPAGDKRPVRIVTEDEVRGTCNRLMVGGINTITSYYSFNGLSTSQLQRLNLWVGRCSTMLRGGRQVTDIGVVYPVESVWPRFSPARHGATDSPTAKQVQHAWQAVNRQLYAARRDFTVIDSRTLAEAKVEGGVLISGALRWRVVVLPSVDTLPMKAWDNLVRFWRSGGVVMALAALPRNSQSEFPSARVETLAREVFGAGDEAHVQANSAGGAGVYLPEGTDALLPTALDAVLERDVSVDDAQAPVRATHRLIEGHHVYFLINDGGASWEGKIRVAGEGTGEQCDPAAGAMTPLRGNDVGLKLQPYGGVLLRFPSARTLRRLKVKSGPLPGLSLRALPAVAPSFAKGEFVQAQFVPDATKGASGQSVWRASGELTKGQVDTFLFVTFDYPQPLDLRGAQGLHVQTWTPVGQKTPANLLVILQEKSGGQYLADTGRPLALPGHRTLSVSFSQFSPAGWAKDPNGQLDLDQVTGLRIGWGGYYGAKGERVEFSLAAPQPAVINPTR